MTLSRKWTLVECEIEKKVVDGTPFTDLRPTASNPEYTVTKAVASAGLRKRRSSRAYGRDRSSSLNDYGLEEEEPLSAADLAYAVHIACGNIEYLFGSDSLAQDTYLRSLMDNEGFVPLLYIMQYPDLMYSPAPTDAIFAALSKSTTSRLEVDSINETIRLRENWKSYLMPNAKGGLGLEHRYIKDVPVAASVTKASSTTTTASSPSPLRAAASEYVPKL
jgi:hypothetical protein